MHETMTEQVGMGIVGRDGRGILKNCPMQGSSLYHLSILSFSFSLVDRRSLSAVSCREPQLNEVHRSCNISDWMSPN